MTVAPIPRRGQTPFGSDQAADVHAALGSYTRWAARRILAEGETGMLEAGKSADIAVWDRDPYAAPTWALEDMVCDLTRFRGRAVYGRAE